MNLSRSPIPERGIRRTTGIVLLPFYFIGVILLLASVLPTLGNQPVARDFLRELGIVLLSVATVSMIYEIFVAEEHFKRFSESLAALLERGQSNAAACEQMGIRNIFRTRDLFERSYPVERIAAQAAQGSTFRVFARSLFMIMNRATAIKDAVKAGAVVELACFDPKAPSTPFHRLSGLWQSDIFSALRTFIEEFAEWLPQTMPSGSIEFRFHQLQVLDSYFQFSFDRAVLAAWDLNFGRPTANKRVFSVDTAKDLGAALASRYDACWQTGKVVFKYCNGHVEINDVAECGMAMFSTSGG